jgi:DHA3 family macrolide efflux protein-like MFS transporter
LILLILFAGTNFTLGMLQALLTPLVMSIASAKVLGSVLSIAGFGMLAGTLAMSVWGGPKRRIQGIFGAFLIQGLILFLGGVRPSVPLIAAASFIFLFLLAIINGCSQAIWQSKVALEVQGRVFAVRRMVALSSMPLAYFVAGPLADRVFEPMLAPGGALAGTVGALIGVGKGRGIGLLLMVLGIFMVAGLAVAFANPRLRKLEDELPDVV